MEQARRDAGGKVPLLLATLRPFVSQGVRGMLRIGFGMLPTSARPLWSVRFEPSVPTTVIMDRSLRPGDWGRFGQMIVGNHPDFVTLK